MGQCYNSTLVNASADEAWAAVCDFHNMSGAAPVITNLDKVGDAGGPGSVGEFCDPIYQALLSALKAHFG